MQITVESVSALERKMHIVVPADEITPKVEDRIKQAASQARIKGFRPGKVPVREVRRRFGEGILQEVSSEVMQQSYSDAITQETLTPAGMPRIDDVVIESGKDLSFSATFEVMPDVTPGDVSSIVVTKPSASVTESDLNDMVDKLREQRKQYVEVERAAAMDDQVTIDFEGSKDGEVFEGGTGSDHKLVLGSGSMIPGFEEGIVGMAAGDEKSLELTFPEAYHAEALAGASVVFKVAVKTVAETMLPELNDDFFKLFNVDEGGEPAFRAEVQKNMEKELQSAIDNRVKGQVMDGLLEVTEVDVPKALIDDECGRMRQNMVQQFGGGQQFDENMLPKELFADEAEKRVRLGLIVNAVIEGESIEADADRVKSKIEDIASSYEQPEQLVNYYYSNEQALSQIQGLVLEEQVVERLLGKMAVETVEMSYQEAIQPPQQKADTEAEASTSPEEESEESANVPKSAG
jgi:trigger factor